MEKRWVIVARNSAGKIIFFYKWIVEDESEPVYLGNFVQEAKGWNVTILALYREEDVVEHCQL